jgi:hypothetical protein
MTPSGDRLGDDAGAFWRITCLVYRRAGVGLEALREKFGVGFGFFCNG